MPNKCVQRTGDSVVFCPVRVSPVCHPPLTPSVRSQPHHNREKPCKAEETKEQSKHVLASRMIPSLQIHEPHHHTTTLPPAGAGGADPTTRHRRSGQGSGRLACVATSSSRTMCLSFAPPATRAKREATATHLLTSACSGRVTAQFFFRFERPSPVTRR